MSESATQSADLPDAAGETGTLMLDVRDDAPLDTEEVVLDMPWDDPAELITKAIERVDALGDETREAALDIYLGEDGIGLGRWATADTREFHRGTSAPHDGLPGVGEAYGEKLVEARDEVLPEHPLVEWLREHPDVAVAQTQPTRNAAPEYVEFLKGDPHGFRYAPTDSEYDFEFIVRNVLGMKEDRQGGDSRLSKWAYQYLHVEEIIPKVVPTDAYWFTGGEDD